MEMTQEDLNHINDCIRDMDKRRQPTRILRIADDPFPSPRRHEIERCEEMVKVRQRVIDRVTPLGKAYLAKREMDRQRMRQSLKSAVTIGLTVGMVLLAFLTAFLFFKN